MIPVCIIPDNAGDGRTGILLYNTAVIAGDICRLDNVIIHATYLIAIRCVSAECARQDQEVVRLLEIQRACDQIAVLIAVCRRMVLRCCVALRHFAKLHLIANQISLTVLFYKGRQIFKAIVTIGCACSRRSGCNRRCRCYRCTRCHKHKILIQFPGGVVRVIVAPGQLDRCRCHTHFVRILDAVVVGIIPDVAVNGCSFDGR